MTVTYEHTNAMDIPGYGTLQGGGSYSATGVAAIAAETVPNSTTDQLINIAIDVSAVVACIILSDRVVTIETNSGSSPNNTLVLKAGVPYIFTSDSYDTFKLTTDVTRIYVTNASGGTATVKIFVLQDVTP